MFNFKVLIRNSFRVFALAFIILSAVQVNAAYANSASKAYKALEEIPVQHGRRVKPFASFANESALAILGANKYEGMSSTELMWHWIAEPEAWFSKAMIPISFRPLQKEFGIMLVDKKISPEIVVGHQPFLEKVREANQKKQRKDRLTTLERKRVELYDRAALFQGIASGALPGWMAHPEDPRVGWLPFQALVSADGIETIGQFFSEREVVKLSDQLKDLLDSIRSNESPAVLEPKTQEFASSLQKLFESQGVILDQKVLNQELIYNQLNPFDWAWKLYLFSALFFLAFVLLQRKVTAGFSSGNTSLSRTLALIGGALFISGFLMHTYGFYLRCVIAGRPPVTNMYESIVWVSWGVALFSGFLYGFYRIYIIPFTAALVASLALLIAQSFPVVLSPAVSPLVPVLRSNLWLTVHVLTITLSYGAFALAWGLGHGVVFGYAVKPENTETNKKLAEFLYRSLQIGVILLASGTVLGGVWANYSWGRFWGWDPKETWALIALLGYLLVLHGRYTGWLGTFGIACGSVIAFAGIVMAWYGVNFVLAAGLHSYGFGGGGAQYVLSAALFDIFLVLGAAVIYRKRRAKYLQSVV